MKRAQQGFSVLELLLASTLSLILLSGIITLLSGQQQLFQQQNSLSVLQENARAALQVLHHEIRTAAYIGCPNLQADLPIANATELAITAHNTLMAYPANAAELPANVRNRILPQSEALLIRKLQIDSANLLEPSSSRLVAAPALVIKPGDILGISDCKHLDIFKIAQLKQLGIMQFIIPSQPLRFQYLRGAQVGQLQTLLFYLGKTGRKDESGEPITALYRLDLQNPSLPSELAEFIAQWRFTFDIFDLSTQSIQTVSRSMVKDWATVRAINIDLAFMNNRWKITQNWHTSIALRERNHP